MGFLQLAAEVCKFAQGCTSLKMTMNMDGENKDGSDTDDDDSTEISD